MCFIALNCFPFVSFSLFFPILSFPTSCYFILFPPLSFFLREKDTFNLKPTIYFYIKWETSANNQMKCLRCFTLSEKDTWQAKLQLTTFNFDTGRFEIQLYFMGVRLNTVVICHINAKLCHRFPSSSRWLLERIEYFYHLLLSTGCFLCD